MEQITSTKKDRKTVKALLREIQEAADDALGDLVSDQDAEYWPGLGWQNRYTVLEKDKPLWAVLSKIGSLAQEGIALAE